MSKWKVRSRIAGSLIASPLVSLPVGLGCAAWFLGALLGDEGRLLVRLGIVGLLLGIAAAVHRWKRHGPQIRRAAVEKFREGANCNHEQFLDDLDRRIRADDDERTNQHLAMLRQLHRRMRQVGIFDGDFPGMILPEVKEKTGELYRSCLASLERSLVLRDAALEMMTESARRKLFKSREALLGEVGATIRHLAATLDFLQTAKLEKDNDLHLERMWQELEFGLEVARQVEYRMNDLEHSLDDRLPDQPGNP